MVAQATHDNTSHKITLLHASRATADLPFRTDFEKLATENPNFVYIATVESPSGDWKGERGRVTAEMIKKHVPDLGKPIYYLSGPEGMVKSMRQLLVDLKVNEDNIRTEEFTGY
jgi:ferredoxin-NADP reductase